MITLIVQEESGISRFNEPLTVGVPFPQGRVQQPSELQLVDSQKQTIPCQTQVLAQWSDQSLKWVLFDFQVTVAAHAVEQYEICTGQASHKPAFQGITVENASDAFVVNTGSARFILNITNLTLFEQVVTDGVNMLQQPCRVELLGEHGQVYQHRIARAFIETGGPMRTTVKLEGQTIAGAVEVFAEFFVRFHFYAKSTLTKIDYTLRNPRAAKHPGGLWDLGDEGSIYFDDLSFHIPLRFQGNPIVAWATQPDQPLYKNASGALEIYQDSSGGEHWLSTNHINRFGKIPLSVRGYRVRIDNELKEEGFRAQPRLSLFDNEKKISAAVYRFWENFPKALEVKDHEIILRLFPKQFQDLFELQGGEQKTHTIYLNFQKNADDPQNKNVTDLTWIQSPLIVHATPEWYARTKALSYIIPYNQDPYPQVLELINTAIEGDNTFVQRRELIDEYGWRNFGDLYADHERAYYKGEGLPVSHYNNQYDGVYAFILQFVRSGDPRWFTLLNDLARHVRDIDIYHTDQDIPNYNGGLLWHTFHYHDAGTGTHRGFSRKTMEQEGLDVYGGGPSNEHNYATGLMYHYYMTGDSASKEAVIGLANWVINMDDGSKTRFRWLNTRATGAASMSSSLDYHGPGRGGGYSINTLLDAFLLTDNRIYLDKAEQLIQRCIHPDDNIEKRDLLNLELRWSYTIFLQVLGRYLDLKVERQELDEMFCYARASLLHYAQWMSQHERCSSTAFDTVNYPTETWPAQDLRKGNVFRFAAKYSEPPLKQEFLEKSEFFFEQPLADLFAFDTRTFTRPLMILMTNTAMPSYFYLHPDETSPQAACGEDFGQPQLFKSQLYYVYKLRAFVETAMKTLRRVLGKEWKEPIK